MGRFKKKIIFYGTRRFIICSQEPSTGPYTLFITTIHVRKSHPLVPIPCS